MLTIRLSRIGKKKKPMYRLIISEKGRDPYGRSLEILGSFNPFSKELNVEQERIKYWISKGAQMSPTVNNLLLEKKLIEGKKVKASKPGKKAAEDKKPEETKKAEVKTETAPAEAAKTETPVVAEVKTEEVAK
jgi:small subunit ribosomal protein S16